MEWDYMNDAELEIELAAALKRDLDRLVHRERMIAKEKKSVAAMLVALVACVVFLTGLIIASYVSLL